MLRVRKDHYPRVTFCSADRAKVCVDPGADTGEETVPGERLKTCLYLERLQECKNKNTTRMVTSAKLKLKLGNNRSDYENRLWENNRDDYELNFGLVHELQT